MQMICMCIYIYIHICIRRFLYPSTHTHTHALFLVVFVPKRGRPKCGIDPHDAQLKKCHSGFLTYVYIYISLYMCIYIYIRDYLLGVAMHGRSFLRCCLAPESLESAYFFTGRSLLSCRLR